MFKRKTFENSNNNLILYSIAYLTFILMEYVDEVKQKNNAGTTLQWT